jgi:hypothetical protein
MELLPKIFGPSTYPTVPYGQGDTQEDGLTTLMSRLCQELDIATKSLSKPSNSSLHQSESITPFSVWLNSKKPDVNTSENEFDVGDDDWAILTEFTRVLQELITSCRSAPYVIMGRVATGGKLTEVGISTSTTATSTTERNRNSAMQPSYYLSRFIDSLLVKCVDHIQREKIGIYMAESCWQLVEAHTQLTHIDDGINDETYASTPSIITKEWGARTMEEIRAKAARIKVLTSHTPLLISNKSSVVHNRVVSTSAILSSIKKGELASASKIIERGMDVSESYLRRSQQQFNDVSTQSTPTATGGVVLASWKTPASVDWAVGEKAAGKRSDTQSLLSITVFQCLSTNSDLHNSASRRCFLISCGCWRVAGVLLAVSHSRCCIKVFDKRE